MEDNTTEESKRKEGKYRAKNGRKRNKRLKKRFRFEQQREFTKMRNRVKDRKILRKDEYVNGQKAVRQIKFGIILKIRNKRNINKEGKLLTS